MDKELWNYLAELNELFGINVTDGKDVPWLFDFYKSEAEFEKAVGEEFNICVEAGTAGIISTGEFVFFNEVNYDWNEEGNYEGI